MTIKKCIQRIINFKNLISTNYKRPQELEGAEFYKVMLTSSRITSQFPDLSGCESGNKTYMKNYINTILVAAYMEREGYTLNSWDAYVNYVHPFILKNKPYNSSCSVFNEGITLELFLQHTINHVFRLRNIIALKANNDSAPTALLDDYLEEILPPETSSRILEKTRIAMKIRGQDQKKVWGDNDILVIAYPDTIDRAEAICIISSKTSLRERIYQSIFWATHSRIEGIAKHTFATLDKGSSGKSEIGNRDSDGNARKTRDVLESTMDRVYVFRSSQEVERSYVIKDFEYLKVDLERWREDYFGI